MKDLKSIVKKIDACKKRIAAERDKLRAIIDDVEAIEDCANRAYLDLESAADSLSEYL